MAVFYRDIGYRWSVFLEELPGLRCQPPKDLRRQHHPVGRQQRGGVDRLSEEIEALVVARADLPTAHRTAMGLDHVAAGPVAVGEKAVTALRNSRRASTPASIPSAGKASSAASPMNLTTLPPHAATISPISS